jgi:hypothetical protein
MSRKARKYSFGFEAVRRRLWVDIAWTRRRTSFRHRWHQRMEAGGSTISASDIGVGITSITAASNVDMPRADLIAPGFAYDPAGVVATNGLTPFGGVATGQATLGDLATGRKILNGNRIAPNINNGPASVNYLTVTMKFAVLPQYFTPATFAALVTLTISNGP